MHTLNGHSTFPATWEASNEAIEWLSPEYAPTGNENYPFERQEGFEAEIWPALAAMIPAIISAAPAIINAVSSLVSPKKASPPPSAPPPSAPPPRPAEPPKPTAKPAGPPMRTAQVVRTAPARPVAAPAPTPPPAPAPLTPAAPTTAPDDLTTQVAALIPVLAALVANAAAPQEMLLESQLGPLCSEVAEAVGRSPSEDTETEQIETEDAETEDAETEHTETEHTETEHTETEDIEASTIMRAELQLALVPLPDRATINVGVSPCPTSLLVAQFGRPREELSDECQATTSAFWRDRMVTESVGPFRATGHRKAVGIFREAFAALKASHPDLHDAVGSAGMLCVRHVRGRPGVLSNHALGMAVDLTIDGRLEVRDDDLVQRGLITIHEVFTRFGIFWGAGLRIEDAMHFEVGAELVTRWMQEGSI